ncbi:hypothetical protein DB32_008334 [Sandaracinus amylolyticus]|uniref:Uncharacterized protein n=1 Tax=Sandaracinus amylolyticus TaxID=927083 RepID=A0A0F6YMV9_9BACT|nr:hypothetical protein DB32_008334 [Sandaracinus amylolyticus]
MTTPRRSRQSVTRTAREGLGVASTSHCRHPRGALGHAARAGA